MYSGVSLWSAHQTPGAITVNCVNQPLGMQSFSHMYSAGAAEAVSSGLAGT